MICSTGSDGAGAVDDDAATPAPVSASVSACACAEPDDASLVTIGRVPSSPAITVIKGIAAKAASNGGVLWWINVVVDFGRICGMCAHENCRRTARGQVWMMKDRKIVTREAALVRTDGGAAYYAACDVCAGPRRMD